MADKKPTDRDVTEWLETISVYEREYKKWEGRVAKIVKRYRDEERPKETVGCRFNILWSNVRTAVPAVFSRLPRPDVSRRFKDSDPVGRVASLLLERGLEFETEHYPDYRATMRECVQDRFLGGRGTSWVRYEPHITKAVQVSEDADAESEEALEYECAPTDYVMWKDFGHTIARTWEEVTAVWRKVYMDRQALIARFGEELGSKVPLDTRPEDTKKVSGPDQKYEAVVYEIWDKKTKTAKWLSKSMGQFLDEQPDPLQLENFWPCPRPLFATLTNDSLVPVPDFTLYQDQANTLDLIADRIEGLVKAIQVKGVYDATFPELARLFTEGENGTLIPVKNWAAFAEKQGLRGALDVVDLTPIFNALDRLYTAAEQQKAQIYEITGLADIIRGSTDPNETATAQKMKGNFGSMSLRAMQNDVAQFATEILQIKAQIMCRHFQPETLAAIGGASTLSPEDQQLVPQAIQLLKSSPLRDFRIEIVADSMVYMDEVQEKADRMELASSVGSYLKEALPVAGQSPELAPLLLELMRFIVTGFKVGKSIEGAFDQAAEALKKAAANPQQKPDPEMAKVQADAQLQQQKIQSEAQLAERKAQLDAQVAQAQQMAQAQQAQQEAQLEAQRDAQKAQLDAQVSQHKAQLDAQNRAQEMAFERWKAELDARTKVAVAEISAGATLAGAQLKAAQQEATNGAISDKLGSIADAVGADRVAVRDGNGRVQGSQMVKKPAKPSGMQ